MYSTSTWKVDKDNSQEFLKCCRKNTNTAPNCILTLLSVHGKSSRNPHIVVAMSVHAPFAY